MSQQLFYIAMAGLNATMERVSAAANNLANRGTTAFKAQKPVFQDLPLYGQGEPDRVMVRATDSWGNWAFAGRSVLIRTRPPGSTVGPE